MIDSVVVRVEGIETDAHRQLSQTAKRRLLQIVSPILFLIVWQVLDMFHVLNNQFIPAPSTVIASFVTDMQSGQLWSDLDISLYRIGLGFVIGVVPGIVIGLSSGLFPMIRMVVDPIVSATYSIPKLALVPLFMLIFGLTETEKILLIAAGCIFPVVINVTSGVVNLDKRYMEVAKNLALFFGIVAFV